MLDSIAVVVPNATVRTLMHGAFSQGKLIKSVFTMHDSSHEVMSLTIAGTVVLDLLPLFVLSRRGAFSHMLLRMCLYKCLSACLSSVPALVQCTPLHLPRPKLPAALSETRKHCSYPSCSSLLGMDLHSMLNLVHTYMPHQMWKVWCQLRSVCRLWGPVFES